MPSLKIKKILEMPQLQNNEKLLVRDYLVFDPANVYYTENYSPHRTTSSADWQQLMKSTPAHKYNFDYRSDRLQQNTFKLALFL